MRTDRSTLCADCAIRFAAAERCPRCGSELVFDTRNPASRRQAIKALKEGKRGKISRSIHIDRVGAVYLKYVVPVATLLVFVVMFRLRGPTTGLVSAFAAFWGLLALLLAAVVVSYAVWLLVALGKALIGIVLSRRFSGRLPRVVTTDEQDFGSLRGLHEVRGRVRTLAPTFSPLTHTPCAAFRLVGEGPIGNVDDAGGVPFELVVGGEAVAHVDPNPASIILEVDSPPRVVRLDRELRTFLEQRGVFPERGPVQLSEATLVDGDDVIVQGAFETGMEAEGYRDARRLRHFTETKGCPLVIRRI